MPPKVLSKIFWNLWKLARIFSWVRKTDTNENHKMVLAIMITLTIPKMWAGVSGEITKVNKLKKKSVAFGFNTFVKKPIFIADRGEMSAFFACSLIFTFEDLEKRDFAPM